jgi:mannose-6-phosphate isomerase-like protein (cupin superfamily)
VAEGVGRARIEPDPEGRFHSLRRPLGVTSFGLNEICLRPGQRGRIHRHERQEEVFLVLEGTLTISIEGEEQRLERGELISVAPSLRRQLINADREPLLLLAIGGEGEHVGRDGEAFEDWDDEGGRTPQEVPLPEDLPIAGD